LPYAKYLKEIEYNELAQCRFGNELKINKNEVWYFKITGHGHVYPGDTNPKVLPLYLSEFIGAAEIWKFFRRW